MPAHPVEGPTGLGQPAERVTGLRLLLVAGEGQLGRAGAGGEGIGVAEHRDLGRERGVLARRRADLLDLGQPEAQLGGLAVELGAAAAQVGEQGLDLAQPGVGDAVLRQRRADRRARVAVQGGPLASRLEQPLLVGLAVHRDELGGEFAEHGEGRLPPAEVGARAAIRAHRTGDQQDSVVPLGPGLLRPQRGGAALGERRAGPRPASGRRRHGRRRSRPARPAAAQARSRPWSCPHPSRR